MSAPVEVIVFPDLKRQARERAAVERQKLQAAEQWVEDERRRRRDARRAAWQPAVTITTSKG